MSSYLIFFAFFTSSKSFVHIAFVFSRQYFLIIFIFVFNFASE